MNDSQNRYIDPETGRLLDSAQSEVIGAVGGGLLGSAAINAAGQYNTYKSGLVAHDQIPALIANTEAMLEKDRLDLELVELAHQYRADPSVLDQYNPEARELIRQDIDLLERIHGREEWDRINELPFRQRAEMFLKSKKPSYEGYPHRVVEEMKGIYGPRPMHPEVPVVLQEEIAAKTKDIDDFKAMLDQPVKFNWRAAAPSLDHYKPRNLLGTVMNPYVATGLFVGAMGGKAYDEYNKHKALIEQREMLSEKTAALKLPKLKMPKPKTPSNTPLIPKKVKRVGTLGLGAGVLGYTGVKGTQQFQEGSDLATRMKTEGIMAKTPAERQKELAGQTKLAKDTTIEGMDQHMKTAYEKYEELEKIAGIGSSLKKGMDDFTGKNVKAKQKMLDDAHQFGDDEGVISLLDKNLAYGKKDRNIARGVVGAAAGTGAAGTGVAIHHHNQEKTAFEKYEDLEKIALSLGGVGNMAKGVKESAKNFGGAVKKTLHDASGKDVKKWEATRERVVESRMGEKGLRATDKRIAQAKADTSLARKQVGIAAGGLAAGGAGAAVAGKMIHDRNQEKTAFEKYEDLEKVALSLGGAGEKAKDLYQSGKAGAGNLYQGAKQSASNGAQKAKDAANRAKESVKKTVHTAQGKEVEKWENALERSQDMGMGEKALRPTEKRLAQAQEDQAKARKQIGLAAGGVAVGGAGAAVAGKMIHDRKQEKTALEKYEELSKEAGIGNAVKKGFNHLTGKNVKFHQGMVDDSIKLGDSVGTIQMLQGNVDAAKKSRNIARGVVGGTAGAAAAGTAGGMMAAKSNGQEKVAAVTQEDSQYAIDHPLKKTFGDGARVGAMLGAPLGAIGGGVTGLALAREKFRGSPAAALGMAAGGAATGALGGGLLGGTAGAGASPGMALERNYANEKLHEGGSGASAGALMGGLLGGGMTAMSAPASISMTGRVAPAIAGVAGSAALGAGVGSLIGSNQEKHYNNVHNGEFETSKMLEHRQARQGHQQVAELESDMIEKAAEEAINELFKEASAAIADDKMEKVAGIQSPISKINGSMFGYDRLK